MKIYILVPQKKKNTHKKINKKKIKDVTEKKNANYLNKYILIKY